MALTTATAEDIERRMAEDLSKWGAAYKRLLAERQEAEAKALDALGRYKFQMFGYWAGVWVHLNRIIGDKKPSPFAHIVKAARGGE